MSTLLATALVLASAVAQLALDAVLGGGWGVPVLPVATLAAWSRVRGPAEVSAAVPVAAVVLGTASESRVGWVLLLLLVAPLLGVAIPRGGVARSLALAGLAGAAGALVFLGALSLEATPALEVAAASRAAAWTGAGAVAIAAVLYPFRPRERGLFE